MSEVITATIKGVELVFRTHPRLFSPRAIDRGTLAMIDSLEFGPDEKVLDLGCGYGVVGILVAKLLGPDAVLMVDSDPLAVEFARANAELNGVGSVRVVVSDAYENLDQSGFTAIPVNPPYHTDFSVAKRFIEGGFRRLTIGGRMVMVVKRRKWYANKLRAVFGGVHVRDVTGYYVMTAQRRTERRPERRRCARQQEGR
jgi:16S rRNA (guanine1207-N2)-methyltransferase